MYLKNITIFCKRFSLHVLASGIFSIDNSIFIFLLVEKKERQLCQERY